MAIGGPLESFTYDNRRFKVTGDTDASRNLGGYSNTTSANGDLSATSVLTAMPWKMTGVVARLDSANKDQEFLQNSVNRGRFVPITFTYADGSVYSGLGMVDGDNEFSNAAATATLDFSGTGSLVQQ